MIQNFNFKIKLDSKNRVYSFSYSKDSHLDDFLSFLKSEIIDLDFDDIYQNLSIKLMEKLSQTKFDFGLSLFEIDFILISFKKYLEDFRGLNIGNFINPNEIICRCNKIDLNDLNHLMQTHHHNKNEIIKACHISKICGKCEILFHEYLAIRK